jgi:hypothetical protein
MKKYLAIALLAICIFGSCKKDTASTDPTDPVVSTMNVSRTTIGVGTSAGYTDTFTVQANLDWTITLSSGLASWVTLDSMKGGSGKTVVKISISNNPTASQTGTITVSPVNNSTVSPQVITLTQDVYGLVWQKGYGGSTQAVVLDKDGGYVFSGDAGNGLPGRIFKTDANGNKLWEALTSAKDQLSSVIVAPDGGYVAAGRRLLEDPVTHYYIGQDVIVVKLNASGVKVWEKTFGGSANDYGYRVIPATGGGYIVSGSTDSGNGDVTTQRGNGDVWILKVDVNGNKVWQKTYGGSKYESMAAVAPTADGGYVLTATTESTDGDVSRTTTGWDVLVIKVDASGNKIWSKTFGGSGEDDPQGIVATIDGGFVIAGETESNDGDVTGNHSGDFDFWALKLDKDGQKVWQSTFGGTNRDYAYDITALSDGNFMMTGFTVSNNNGDVTGYQGSWDYWVVKVSSSGKKMWQRAFGGPGQDQGSAIMGTTDGAVIVAGYGGGNGGDISGFGGGSWVIKLK